MPDQKNIYQFIAALEEELVGLNAQRASVIARLQEFRREKILLAQSGSQLSLIFRLPAVTNQSSEDDKIALFRTLFKGRDDVYPRRFEGAKTGKQDVTFTETGCIAIAG